MILLMTIAAASAALPTRTPLRSLPIAPAKLVARAEPTRVDFAPGQVMPEHLHTVPVICFAAKGSFMTRIGDGPEQALAEGGVSIEPAQTIVHFFRNASTTSAAQLLCVSLAGAKDTRLNIMPPPPR